MTVTDSQTMPWRTDQPIGKQWKQSSDGRAADHNEGGYARASYASGGGGASRVPRIAGAVTASPALVSCVLVGYAPCVERPAFDLLGRG